MRRRRIRALLAPLTVLVTAAPAMAAHPAAADTLPGSWRSVGAALRSPGLPYIAGRVTALAVAPGPPATELAGTIGGLWKRTATGAWKDVTRSSWPATAIGALAVDPAAPRVVYAGTGIDPNDDSNAQPGAGLLKSTDGGSNWSPLRASERLLRGHSVQGVIVDPRAHQIVVAAADDGLFRSTDGGASWRKVVSLDSATVHLTVDAVSGQMLAGVAAGETIRTQGSAHESDHAVLDSSNGGASWTAYAIDSGRPSAAAVVPAISTTSGSNGTTYAYVLYIPSDGGAGVLSTGSDGKHWTARTTNNVTAFGPRAQLVVDPKDPTIAYFATGGPSDIYSYAYGATSTMKLGTCYWPDYHALSVGPLLSDPSREALYAGNDGGTCVHDFVKASDTEDNDGLVSGLEYGVSAQSGSLALSGAQDLGVDLSRGGSTSVESDSSDAFGVLIDQLHPSTFYDATYSGGLSFNRSTDGGRTWHGLNLPSPPVFAATPTLRLVQAVGAPKLLILPTGSGQLYISTDDGRTWTMRRFPGSTGMLSSVRAATFPDSRTPVIYGGTEGGQIWRSANFGRTWQRAGREFSLSVNDLALDPGGSTRHAERLYAALGLYGSFQYESPGPQAVGDVQMSADGGHGWHDIGRGLGQSSVNALALGGRALLAGTDHSVLAYRNGRWRSASAGLPNVRVNDLELSHDGRAFYAATYGRGTWEAPVRPGR